MHMIQTQYDLAKVVFTDKFGGNDIIIAIMEPFQESVAVHSLTRKKKAWIMAEVAFLDASSKVKKNAITERSLNL